jgi:crotonobetainyl-CoA:carnitine CoA-transferase CaiB-like acyl-CoA transferase
MTKLKTKHYWLELCKKAGVPASPINSLTEAFADEQSKARRLIETLRHPTLGSLPTVASPFKASLNTQVSAPPLLGQHTFEVLQEQLGFSLDELEGLEQAGVIKATSG